MAKPPASFLERFSQGASPALAEESRAMLDQISKSRRAAASFYPFFLAESQVRRPGGDETPDEQP